MTLAKLRNALEWGLMVALVFGGGMIAQAQQDQATPANDQEPPGKIVRIAPAGDANTTVTGDVANGQIQLHGPEQPELPKHWIGVLGGPVTDELRAQIDIPEGQGVLVRHVVPESPAGKAGLKPFDILLQANDTKLADVGELTALVKSAGEGGGKITLDVLRRGKHETISITPEARPESVAGEPDAMPGPGGAGWGFGGMGPGHHGPGGMGGPMQFRMFGPGTVLSQQGFNLSQMPNGVSVSIQKQNDEPAHITVQRGSDTWNIVGDDPSSLAQLPDDVRPFVERLLAGGGRMQLPLPAMPNMPMPPGMPGATLPQAFDGNMLQERLQKMEEHMQQMQQQMEQQFSQPPADNPADGNQPESDSQ